MFVGVNAHGLPVPLWPLAAQTTTTKLAAALPAHRGPPDARVCVVHK